MRGCTRTRKAGSLRRAAATVEMAVVAPLLLGLIFGIIEYGWVFMVQSTLTSATREACRVGILPGSTDADIQARFAEAVSTTGIGVASGPSATDGYRLTVARSAAGASIQTVKVTVNVPWAKASLVGGALLPSPKKVIGVLTGDSGGAERTADLVASCSMMKEGAS